MLTTDIVWLQQETVNLPDGTQTVALVPHLYAAVRAGDLNAQGGLLSGNTVAINSTGEVRNGGTILGRTLLEINANTINHLGGQIAANDVKLTARDDINVTGASVTAQNSLRAQAGKDINITSTTASTEGGSGNYTYSRTGLDRMAGLYVAGPGTLLASAGNDLNIIGATIQGAGNTELVAANSVNLGTLQASQSNNVGAGDAKNHLLTSQTSDVGSKASAGKDLTITAGQNVIAKAADLKAQGDASITAQGTVLLNAGQTRSSYDAVLTKSSSDLISTTTTQTQTQASAATAQVSQVQGQNVSIVAGQHLISVGTQFKGTDSLRVEGQDTSTFYAASNVHQSTTTVKSTTSMLGFQLEDKTISDSLATSTSIGTTLLSDKKIEIGVGNKTELQGATVEAQQIAFIQTDPTKAGELILGGSTDTTQKAHTEKSETAGVYQEMKGKGSTTETLNQTQIKGNVTFDSALKITVQIPKDVQATPGGQALQSQLQALSSSSLASTPQALAYLEQLKANPNVKWDKVALANEQWSYDQAGLTPAGAALLSIAVAAYMPGASGLFGTTTATFAGAALNAGFAALASQAAVAMVNNKADIGKTLEQLGKEESIKGLLTTMLTAGALDKLGQNLTIDGVKFSDISAKSDFGPLLLKNVTNNLASSAMDAALNGKAFDEKMLTNALASALVTTGMAQGANVIGDAKEHNDINGFTQKVAHAVLGCAGGAATAGNMSGCGAGAVGAVVGEMAAEYYMDSNKDNGKTFAENKADALAFAKVMSATAGVIAGGGGDNAAAVNIANTTGTNAAENNYLNHAEASRLLELQKKANNGTLTEKESQERQTLIAHDKESSAKLHACGSSNTPECQTVKADFAKAQQSFLPTQTDIQTWANEKAKTSPYSAAQLVDAYNASFTQGPLPPTQTSSGDLYGAADWIRNELSNEAKVSGSANVLDKIYMGWATANAPAVGAAITSGIIVNQALPKAAAKVANSVATALDNRALAKEQDKAKTDGQMARRKPV